MRPDEMTAILEQVKDYTNSQRLGYIGKKIITWDGDTAGKVIIESELGNACKISDAPIDTSHLTLKRIILTGTDGTNYVEWDIFDVVSVESIPEYGLFGITGGTGVTFFAVVHQDSEMFSKGVYLYFTTHSSGLLEYISLVEFEELHPIPAEYIPPLDALILNGADGSKHKIYVDESGTLQNVTLT